MDARIRERLAAFLPRYQPLSMFGRMRAFCGAFIGISITGIVTALWLGGHVEHLPMLIAPMGASAVLLFAAPASPLAQPWSMLGGNLISAFVGVTAARLIPDQMIAAGAAVAGAIFLMSMLRCLHPPGGAVALTAVVGGPIIAQAGYGFAIAPVGVNSLLLLLIALAFNNATRQSYPHLAPRVEQIQTTNDPPPQERVGFTRADVDRALKHYGELLDVTRDDLDALFRQVEVQAHRRLHGEITCAMIMSRDLICIRADDDADKATALMRAHDLRALPVIDVNGHAEGVTEWSDLISADGGAERWMRQRFAVSRPDTPIDELLQIMSAGGAHIVMITDPAGV
ncbi:MAG: HPP family protein, partial [Caulobacterales bacterium]